jgi:birA, biotin-[acetyl-CoA-carboxylase] ligase region
MHTIHLKTIDSTNTYAKKLSSSFPHGQITCIYADEQTAGKGRQKRSWISPPNVNLYVTFFLQLPMNTPQLTSIGQILALSCATCLHKHDLSAQIKWPNDIQLHSKKIGGILCEIDFAPPLANLFLGIGLNVNMEKNLLAQIDQPATSLLAETNKTWDREKLLQELQMQFELDLKTFKQKGFAPFHAQLNNLLSMKGKTVSLFDGQETWTGICDSINSNGEFCLLLQNGQIKTFSSGDVSLREKHGQPDDA